MTEGRSIRFVSFFAIILAQCYTLYSLPAVILAPIVLSHGLELSSAGLIVGAFGIGFFLGVLAIGLLLPNLGLRFSLITGALMCGTFSHLCGLTQYFSSNDAFFTAIAILFRGLSGFSSGVAGGAVSASLPLFHTTSQMSRVPIATAAAATLGFGIGPSIGGGIALLGGAFYAPFAVLGILFFVEAIVLYPLLGDEDIACPDVRCLLWYSVKRPLVLIASLNVTAVCVSLGFMVMVLQPFLCGEYFDHLSPIKVGSLFLFTAPSGVMGIVPYSCGIVVLLFWISYIAMALPLFLFALHTVPNMNEVLITLFVLSMCFGVAVPTSLHCLSAEVKSAFHVQDDGIYSSTVAPFLFSLAAGLGMTIGGFVGGFLAQNMDVCHAAGIWGYTVMIYACLLTVYMIVRQIWPYRTGICRRLSISEESMSGETRPFLS